jgi:hypothetical protein
MNFEIAHWEIPENGADLDDPYPDSPDYVLVPLVGVVWGLKRSGLVNTLT